MMPLHYERDVISFASERVIQSMASSARDAPERDCALFDIGTDDMGEIAAAARLVRRDSHACLMLGACLADPQAIAWLERAHPDLSQGPADLQSAALTTELCQML